MFPPKQNGFDLSARPLSLSLTNQKHSASIKFKFGRFNFVSLICLDEAVF